MAIKLGSLVRDMYTGFEGVANSRTEWLYGCTRIGIEPIKLDKDGKKQDAEVFDEQRVEMVKPEAPKMSHASTATTGGPHPAPPRNPDPAR